MANLKLIHRSEEICGKQVRVYYDREWQEYVVRFYSDRVHMDASDSFTNDKQDALDTADYFIREELGIATPRQLRRIHA